MTGEPEIELPELFVEGDEGWTYYSWALSMEEIRNVYFAETGRYPDEDEFFRGFNA